MAIDQFDYIDDDDLIESLEHRGYTIIKYNFSLIDEYKLQHFLKVIEGYSIEEIEKKLPIRKF